MTEPLKSLSLWDKFWNKLVPEAPSSIQIANEEILAFQEARRLYAAQAEHQLLENAKLRAEVALIEEANARERNLAKGHATVARASFHLLSSVKGDKEQVEIRVVCLLKETCDEQRTIEWTVERKSNSSLITKYVDLNGIKDFVRSKSSWQLGFEPWLSGHLTTLQLSKVTRDSILESIEFVKTG